MAERAVHPLPTEVHHCAACGSSYAALTVDDATALITGLPPAVAAAVAEVPTELRAVRPSPTVWSVVEYLCHLRDACVTSTIRLHRARTEERPVIEPMLNDLRARRFRYAEHDPDAVLAELRFAVRGLCDEIERVAPDGWTRTVVRLPGEERTVRWLVRHAAHEARHHLDDIARVGREAALVAYYDNELPDRASRPVPEQRVARRTGFLDRVRREGRRSVLEIGAGAGVDAETFVAAGLRYTGVDLAPRSAVLCGERGLDVRVASVLALPFGDHAFDAGWTMSTLLHVADADLDVALAEIVRVLRPGAPVGIGLWGAAAGRELRSPERPQYGPPRFFSFRTDGAMRAALARHGHVEEWSTWPGSDELHYQWAVLRTSE